VSHSARVFDFVSNGLYLRVCKCQRFLPRGPAQREPSANSRQQTCIPGLRDDGGGGWVGERILAWIYSCVVWTESKLLAM